MARTGRWPGKWPTPCAADSDRGPDLGEMKRRQRNYPQKLTTSVLLWPTPRANDAEKRGAIAQDSRNGLPAAAQWATPTTRDHRSGKASQATHDRNSRPLSEQVGDLLNPTWVEWLMDWPINWTDPDGGPSSEGFREWLESNRTALIACVDAATVRWHSAAPLPGTSSEDP